MSSKKSGAMAKGHKKGNGRHKAKIPIQVVKKHQTIDANKQKNVNEIKDVAALSWTSEEEKLYEASAASADINASTMDRAEFEAVKSQIANWIESIRTPLRKSMVI